MKTLKIILLLVLAFVLNTQAQNRNIILRTNNNEKFIAFVNQIQINNQPLSEVAITGLTDNYYNIKIQTMSNRFVQNNLYAVPQSEIVYVFTLNQRNQNQNYIIQSVYPISYTNSGNNIFPWQTNNGNLNSGNAQINININNQVNTQQTAIIETPLETVIYVDGYEGDIGCDRPISDSRFHDMLATIKKQNFAVSKKRIAKQIISSNCVVVEQVVAILSLFDFESDKLEMAKFAYDFTYDIENYYKVNTVFDFESSIEDLDDFLLGK